MIELEKRFTLALAAFNKSKQADGWGSNNVKAPDSLMKREPIMEKSSFIGDESEEKNIISLKDEEGKIVIVRFRGTGVSTLSFDDKS